jgi:hypothetical protein
MLRHPDRHWQTEWSASFLDVLDDRVDEEYRGKKLAIAAHPAILRWLADPGCTHPMAADGLADEDWDVRETDLRRRKEQAAWLMAISARLPEVAQPWNTYSDAGYRLAAFVRKCAEEVNFDKECGEAVSLHLCNLPALLGEKDYALLKSRIIEHIRTCRKPAEPGTLAVPASRPARPGGSEDD